MLKSILVPLDGSRLCDAAIGLALQLASRHEALVVGLGVVDEELLKAGEAVPLGAGAFKQRRDAIRVHHETRHADQLIEQFALRCTAAGVPSKPLEDTGNPTERIALQAQRFDLIIVGQRTFFNPVLPNASDDTLEELLKHSPRPVIAVPEVVRQGASVVVGYDGSVPASRALQLFHELEIYKSLPVEVVTIGHDHCESIRHADRAVDFLRQHGRKVTARALDPGSQGIAATLLSAAEQADAQLLVVGVHSRSAIREFFTGSTAIQLLHSSRLPLFFSH